MSVRQDHAPSALGPSRTTAVAEGLAALVGLVALSATIFGLLTWGAVLLVRMLLT